ncbi:TetR/AcrR family transcriptional regulator [Nocardioides sp.]|uniref:TetR/AcrR family transcriptional regulator n=1 Tax=Nocardioides sp. TaxID=35761 RepID=UPI002C308BD9|nr:TetR/AcrR family transcriptional regulator [Nocardioides sp.]HSX68426.1 TetR/AcrR family transcriptional regulator [Nocardioides sp.]
MEQVDGRRARGDATRRTVAREAAMVATVSGLDSITVGGLAAATGVSKSGILTVFGSRESIQVAAVGEARKIFREAVMAPAWGAEPGAQRLHAILDAWLAYQRGEVFRGGCFLTATSVEYGHRDGAVADSVRALKREWLTLLAADLATAGHPEPDDAAFRIDAFLAGANTMHQLFGGDGALEQGVRHAHAVVDEAR